jgi:hypothetical protein
MHLLRLSLLAVALSPAVGCKQIDEWRDRMAGGKKPATPVQSVTAEQLVAYLNTQSSRLQSVSYGHATVSAKEGLISYPALRGNLAASQPRNFRMVGMGGTMGARIDLGSNPEQFWVYVDAPTVKPMFVFASHTDFESGRARLPGGIPFEPDWVMQALGMTTFPTNVQYEVKPDDKARTYTLSWPATTPTGMPIRKEIVFLADDADSSREQAQVRRHAIRDAKGKLLCSADIKSARTIPVGGTDPRSGQPLVVQCPTHVVLRWEEQNFSMDMLLDKPQVNQSLTPERLRELFSRPTNYGVPINLAEGRVPVPNK